MAVRVAAVVAANAAAAAAVAGLVVGREKKVRVVAAIRV